MAMNHEHGGASGDRRETDDGPCRCYDCGLLYGEPGFQDLIIPLSAWEQISPTGDEGGTLCACCMCRRLEAKGITCAGAFMSGPILTVDRTTMQAARQAENAWLEIERLRGFEVLDAAATSNTAEEVAPRRPTTRRLLFEELSEVADRLAKLEESWRIIESPDVIMAAIDRIDERLRALEERPRDWKDEECRAAYGGLNTALQQALSQIRTIENRIETIVEDYTNGLSRLNEVVFVDDRGPVEKGEIP